LNTPIWSFYYHNGPAHVQGHVEAINEAEAYLVAQRYCRDNGYRPPAKVFPFILATPAILKTVAPAPEAEPLPDAMEATTASKVSR
jgi:hypothetical protein